MQKLILPDVPIEECKSKYEFFKDIHSVRHLCAGGEIGKYNYHGFGGCFKYAIELGWSNLYSVGSEY